MGVYDTIVLLVIAFLNDLKVQTLCVQTSASRNRFVIADSTYKMGRNCIAIPKIECQTLMNRTYENRKIFEVETLETVAKMAAKSLL